jgi:hypothetical protein
MAQPRTTTIPEEVRIYAFDYPDFCIYQQILPSKAEFLNTVQEIIRACPGIASIWRNILQEPISLGYISWNSIIMLIAATYKHDTSHHHCIGKEETHFLIKMCLLLSRTIQFPPFPGGDDSKMHFYAVTRTKIREAYDHFEEHIFKDLDKMMSRRCFQSIRDEPNHTDNRVTFYFGLKTYHIMEELQILPPALVDPWGTVPSFISPPPLR